MNMRQDIRRSIIEQHPEVQWADRAGAVIASGYIEHEAVDTVAFVTVVLVRGESGMYVKAIVTNEDAETGSAMAELEDGHLAVQTALRRFTERN